MQMPEPSTARLVTEYVRDYLLAAQRRGETIRAIAKRLGISHPRVAQLSNPASYPNTEVSIDLEQAVADVLHGGSIDALRRAARSFAGDSGALVLVEGDDAPPSSK